MKEVYSPFKAAHHAEKIQQLKQGNLILPTQVQIDPTNRCNHACVYCFYRCAKDKRLNAKFKDSDHMDTNTLLNLMDEFVSLKIPAIQFTGGGEPLMHRDFHAILKKTVESKLQWSLVSNGSLLNFDYSNLYKTASWIRLSIDAASRGIYSLSQGVKEKDFDIVIENIKWLVQSCPKTRIGLSFVVNPINYKEIVDFTRLAKKLGASNVRFSVSYTPQGIEIFKERWDSILELAREAKKLQTDDFTVFDLITDHLMNLDMATKGYSTCGYQHFTSVIGADYIIYPCCTLKYTPIGNFGSLKDNTFEEIWFGEKRKKWLTSNHVSKVCDKHPCWMDKKNEFIGYLLANDPPDVNYI